MSNLTFRIACLGALLLATGGCSLFDVNGPQQLEVHALFDGREVAGVGCMLANDNGRWYVALPARVTVVRSRGALSVDCLREGAGSIAEQAEAPLERSRLAAHLSIPADGGYHADGRIGAGLSYPATLNVVMQAPRAAGPVPAVASPVF
jgi:hypothetical protein